MNSVIEILNVSRWKKITKKTVVHFWKNHWCPLLCLCLILSFIFINFKRKADHFELNWKISNRTPDVLKNTDIDRHPLQIQESSHILPHHHDSHTAHFLCMDCSQNSSPPLEIEKKVIVTSLFNWHDFFKITNGLSFCRIQKKLECLVKHQQFASNKSTQIMHYRNWHFWLQHFTLILFWKKNVTKNVTHILIYVGLVLKWPLNQWQLTMTSTTPCSIRTNACESTQAINTGGTLSTRIISTVIFTNNWKQRIFMIEIISFVSWIGH